MAANPLGILAATLLEGENLLATIVLDHFGLDGGALHEGSAELGIGTFADDQDFLEFDRRAGFGVELLDGDDIVGHDAVLLTAGLDDCEHYFILSCSFRLCLAAAVFLSAVERAGILRSRLLPVGLRNTF